MKINWKVRIKNPWFWIGLAGVIFSPVLASMGIDAADLNSWESVLDMLKNFISNPYLIGSAVMAVLSFLGIAADPTTAGLSDSKRALTYKRPNKGE